MFTYWSAVCLQKFTSSAMGQPSSSTITASEDLFSLAEASNLSLKQSEQAECRQVRIFGDLEAHRVKQNMQTVS